VSSSQESCTGGITERMECQQSHVLLKEQGKKESGCFMGMLATSGYIRVDANLDYL